MYAFLDTETTGIYPDQCFDPAKRRDNYQPKLITIGVQLVTEELQFHKAIELKIAVPQEWLDEPYNIECMTYQKALEVNGFTLESLPHGMDEAEASKELAEFLENNNVTHIFAHRASFDFRFLLETPWNMQAEQFVCTKPLATRALPEGTYNGLQNWISHTLAHTALGDARALAMCSLTNKDEFNEWFKTARTLADTPV